MRALTLTALLLAVASPVMAQQPSPCGDHAELGATLRSRYGEEPVVAGMTAEKQIMQIWSSRSGETWTAAILYPSGQLCVVGTGKYLSVRPYPVDEVGG